MTDAAQNAAAQVQQENQKEQKSHIKQLEKQIALLQSRVQKLQSSRWKIPKGSKKKSLRNTFCRAIIPDTHGCLVHLPSVQAVLQDLEFLRPREVVWLGDHLECGGFLAQHHTIGYVAQTEYTFEDDVDACNDLLDKVQATSKATHYYLEGNHERRIEAWCLTQALRKKEDANFLLKHFGVENQLNLEKRGIHLFKQGRFYMDLPIPATIQLGKCYFTHGITTAKHAAARTLQRFGQNTVFGHTHRADEMSTYTVSEGAIKAWCPGCLCERQPLWRHSEPTEWTHGYAVQLCQPDGSFMHLQVPIIDGRSYLIPFTEAAT